MTIYSQISLKSKTIRTVIIAGETWLNAEDVQTLLDPLGFQTANPSQDDADDVATFDQNPVRSFGNGWLGEALPLPVCTCRSTDLYRAYEIWCHEHDLPAYCPKQFYPRFHREFAETSKQFLLINGKTTRCVVVGPWPRRSHESGQRLRDIDASDVRRFSDALADYIRHGE